MPRLDPGSQNKCQKQQQILATVYCSIQIGAEVSIEAYTAICFLYDYDRCPTLGRWCRDQNPLDIQMPQPLVQKGWGCIWYWTFLTENHLTAFFQMQVA